LTIIDEFAALIIPLLSPPDRGKAPLAFPNAFASSTRLPPRQWRPRPQRIAVPNAHFRGLLEWQAQRPAARCESCARGPRCLPPDLPHRSPIPSRLTRPERRLLDRACRAPALEERDRALRELKTPQGLRFERVADADRDRDLLFGGVAAFVPALHEPDEVLVRAWAILVTTDWVVDMREHVAYGHHRGRPSPEAASTRGCARRARRTSSRS
jgi:hypothetical protein